MLPKRSLVLLNFLAIYTIWGSTYLTIKWAIADIPPFFLAGFRFLCAGTLLYGLSLFKREVALDRPTMIRAFFSGSLLVMGNALVCVAEVSISSGMAAVIVGSVPIWVMVLNWMFFEKKQPTMVQFFGIVCSLVGVLLLSRSQGSDTKESLLGVVAIIGAVISWSVGTLVQRQAKTSGRLIRYSGFQLGFGSLIAFAAGFITHEQSDFSLAAIHPLALGSLLYMVIFGSAIAFSSYLWLSLHVETSKVSTYAVANPVIAVWLGWILLDEPINLKIILSSLLILLGIGFVVFRLRSPVLKS